MSMIVEHHDDEVNEGQNSLRGNAGYKGGSICYAYQGEMWAQEMIADKLTRRIYIHSGDVLAVWAHDERGTVSYVAKSPRWDGEWQLPLLYPDRTDIAILRLEAEDRFNTNKMSGVATWAAEQLKRANIATAVALDKNGVVCAWEPGNTGPTLVAKGPYRKEGM